MTKMLALVGTTLGSGIGWWIGEQFGPMTAFIVSMIGFGLGMWGGRWLADHWGA